MSNYSLPYYRNPLISQRTNTRLTVRTLFCIALVPHVFPPPFPLSPFGHALSILGRMLPLTFLPFTVYPAFARLPSLLLQYSEYHLYHLLPAAR